MFIDEKRQGEITVEPAIEPWRQILLNAADLIDRHGWCRKTAQNAKGNICAQQAIFLAVVENGKPFEEPLNIILWRGVTHSFGSFIQERVVVFNDGAKNVEEVTSALRKCAREGTWKMPEASTE
jgi:hypothetical protein